MKASLNNSRAVEWLADCDRVRLWLACLAFGLMLCGCSQQDQGTAGSPSKDLAERKQHIKSQESKMSPEAVARKERSIVILRSQNVPCIDHLPVIETEAESTRRTTQEVATREGLDQSTVNRLVQDYELSSAFSPKEKAFIDDPHPSKHDRIQFSWRYEDYWVLLWVLGFTDKLERPTESCDVKQAVTILRDTGRQGFLQKAKLRPQSEILDAADLIYRYHWATEDARVKGKKSPEGLDPGVVMERHYVLNWLIGYMGQAWDDISTDT